MIEISGTTLLWVGIVVAFVILVAVQHFLETRFAGILLGIVCAIGAAVLLVKGLARDSGSQIITSFGLGLVAAAILFFNLTRHRRRAAKTEPERRTPDQGR